MENFDTEICKNCGSTKFKSRAELSEDEKFLIERLRSVWQPSEKESENELFCAKCFYKQESGRKSGTERSA